MDNFLSYFPRILMKTVIEILALAVMIYLLLIAGIAVASEGSSSFPVAESAATMLTGVGMIGIAAILRKKFSR